MQPTPRPSCLDTCAGRSWGTARQQASQRGIWGSREQHEVIGSSGCRIKLPLSLYVYRVPAMRGPLVSKTQEALQQPAFLWEDRHRSNSDAELFRGATAEGVTLTHKEELK